MGAPPWPAPQEFLRSGVRLGGWALHGLAGAAAGVGGAPAPSTVLVVGAAGGGKAAPS